MILDYLYGKAEAGEGLEPYEARQLFDHLNPVELPGIREIGIKLTKEIREKEASLYTCLYISNICANACPYCSYSSRNPNLDRRTLTPEQVRAEAKAIKEMGVPNVILIAGTVPEERYRDLILESTDIVLTEGLNPWIEFENLSQGTLRDLASRGARHFVLFQETYNSDVYRTLHSASRFKGNFLQRLGKGNQAYESGIPNIGIGALLGLHNDIGLEIEGICRHTEDLLEKGASVSISLPAMRSPWRNQFRRPNSWKIEAAYLTLRLALPQVALALSGREASPLRDRLFPVVDLVGTGGVTSPGGRTLSSSSQSEQFLLMDRRSPRVVKRKLETLGVSVLNSVPWTR